MIELRDISFQYEAEEGTGCLKNINLTIQKRETVLLCGASGSGKSTITRLINGLIPQYYEGNLEGKITVEGIEVSAIPLYDTAKKVGTVFQNPRAQFFNVDTTSELAFGCENQGMEEQEIFQRIDHTVAQFQIKKLMGRSIFKLSGGEKQKIACACVSVSNPDIIVLDEPSANLDTDAMEDLKNLIVLWKSQKKTIVIAEHRISYVWDLADRVVIMKAGRVARDTKKEEFKKWSERDAKQYGLRSLRQENAGEMKIECTKKYNREDLIVRNLKFGYEKENLILDIEKINIPQGEIVAIVGSNGIGKTTFLHCLCGFERKCKGILEYKSHLYKNKQRKKLIYMVMQDVNHQLFTESVLDEVLISMKEEDEEKANEILRKLDLLEYASRHPVSLSGGQKQRVAIACAIASEREILLFDEPTSGLDYMHMMRVSALLKALKEMGKTVIVVTHDSELIRNCCTHIIHLKQEKKGDM